jgi:hypothetical protein
VKKRERLSKEREKPDLLILVKDLLSLATETFRAARKIAPHAGAVKRVLRLFDELSQYNEEGVLAEVRKAVEGKE